MTRQATEEEFETLAPALRAELGGAYTVWYNTPVGAAAEGPEIMVSGFASFAGGIRYFSTIFDALPTGDTLGVWATDVAWLIRGAFK